MARSCWSIAQSVKEPLHSSPVLGTPIKALVSAQGVPEHFPQLEPTNYLSLPSYLTLAPHSPLSLLTAQSHGLKHRGRVQCCLCVQKIDSPEQNACNRHAYFSTHSLCVYTLLVATYSYVASKPMLQCTSPIIPLAQTTTLSDATSILEPHRTWYGWLVRYGWLVGLV